MLSCQQLTGDAEGAAVLAKGMPWYMASADVESGQRTGLLSTCSMDSVSGSMSASTFCTLLTHAMTCTASISFRAWWC